MSVSIGQLILLDTLVSVIVDEIDQDGMFWGTDQDGQDYCFTEDRIEHVYTEILEMA